MVSPNLEDILLLTPRCAAVQYFSDHVRDAVRSRGLGILTITVLFVIVIYLIFGAFMRDPTPLYGTCEPTKVPLICPLSFGV